MLMFTSILNGKLQLGQIKLHKNGPHADATLTYLKIITSICDLNNANQSAYAYRQNPKVLSVTRGRKLSEFDSPRYNPEK